MIIYSFYSPLDRSLIRHTLNHIGEEDFSKLQKRWQLNLEDLIDRITQRYRLQPAGDAGRTEE